MIKVDKVSFGYKTKKVIDNVSLEIKDGEFIAIIGVNGSRKIKLN